MTAVEARVRSVLDAPRGHRFSRTPAPALARRSTLPETWEERQQRLLRQMVGNPKVAYRIEHGVMPHWMIVAKERREQAVREAKRREAEPGPIPPRRPRGRHRAPRWRGGWAAATLTYGIALVAGMISQAVALFW
ncbi:hypothetical protein ABZ635_20890 [Nocardiopsis sp. NPDC007018]|uniref:hypothetical protein n=1 Tax=Nocardiopsis sp. NPDC007018 TaxID=3155721 RepID=UPI0033C572CE